MRVLICDDHTLVRAGLRRLLEGFEGVEVVAEAANGDEAVAKSRQHLPDVVLLDLSMPGRGGFEALDELRQVVPQSAVVIMSMHDDPMLVRAALARGASGFVVKEGAPAELEIALRAAASGRTFLSPQVSAPQLQGARARNGGAAPGKGDVEALPPRQRQILVALGAGRTTKQIASDLGISIKTVETHRARIMEALGCRNAVELLRLAVREHDRTSPAPHRAN
ncbi:MAG TPA: response regulator transcription factor [Xanthomonadaceae bacterium]|nr:response regulator transcription factor [Xanthomonadaceae bacterium]